MKRTRRKAQAKAIPQKSLWEKFQNLHARFPGKSKLFCAKGAVFWVIVFYCVKGTAVTIAGLAALYFGLNL